MENQPKEKAFLLSRRKTALYIETTYGARCSVSTLAKMAVSGAGPAFRHLGRFVVYELEDIDSWARGRLSAKVHSTAALPPRDPFRKRPGRPRKPFGQAQRRVEDPALPESTKRVSPKEALDSTWEDFEPAAPNDMS